MTSGILIEQCVYEVVRSIDDTDHEAVRQLNSDSLFMRLLVLIHGELDGPFGCGEALKIRSSMRF